MNKKKLNYIVYYCLEFCLMSFLFGILLLSVVGIDIMNPKFIKKQMEKVNYYSKVVINIVEENKNYLIPSGFDEQVLENLINEEQVRTDINGIVDSFYQTEVYQINTESLKQQLNTNITIYLKERNLEVANPDSLKSFVNQIETIYQEQITLSLPVKKLAPIFIKVKSLCKISLIVSIGLYLVFFYLLKWKYKRGFMEIPLCTCSFLLFFSCFSILNHIDLANILILNEAFSEFLKEFFYGILFHIRVLGICCFIAGLLSNIKFRCKKETLKK